jgi:hypothetical protein
MVANLATPQIEEKKEKKFVCWCFFVFFFGLILPLFLYGWMYFGATLTVWGETLNQVRVISGLVLFWGTYGAFTLDVKLVLNENLGGILSGTQC